MLSFKQFTNHPDRIIGFAEVKHLIGISKSHLNRLENQGYFPRRLKLAKRRVGWSLKEVQEWIEEQKNSRNLSNEV